MYYRFVFKSGTTHQYFTLTKSHVKFSDPETYLTICNALKVE